MPVQKVIESYTSLTDSQKNFLKNPVLAEEYPVDHWVLFFEGICQYDVHGDALRKWVGWLAALSLIVGIGLFMATDASGFGAIPAGIFFVALFGLLLIGWFLMRSLDVNNNLRELIVPVVKILLEETEDNQPLRLDLNFKGSHKDELIEEDTFEEPQPYGRRHITQRLYEHPWFGGEVNLVDGTRVHWTVTDFVRKRKIRVQRGAKTKYKSNVKVKRMLEVVLSVKSSKYGLVEHQGSDEMSSKTQTKDSRHVVKMRRKLVCFSEDEILKPQEFLSTISAAYQQVGLTR